MLRSKIRGRKYALLTVFVLCTFLGTGIKTAVADESGCVTCHLDKEMLKENITAAKGAKSALQSGAG
jgi:hypothetical protein